MSRTKHRGPRREIRRQGLDQATPHRETSRRRLRRWTIDHRQAVFRGLTVAACAASVALTWPLWQTRETPPQLPLLALPAVSVALPLLGALALYLAVPAVGWLAYWVVLGYAIATDQTRLQPEFVSFGLLLAAGLPAPAGVTLARLHLVTLWFYAGLHKLLSIDFLRQTDDPFMLMRGTLVVPPLWMRAVFPWAVVAIEIGTALCAVVPRARRLAAAGAVALHVGILLVLVNADWNYAVWPWNVTCAIAAVLLIAPWRNRLASDLRALGWPARALALAMVLYPVGFYVGLADTYLAHCLYAQNEPRGYVCSYTGEVPAARPGLGEALEYRHQEGTFRCRHIRMIDDVGVPLPPIHRLFEHYFGRTCDGNEFLLIQERRQLYKGSDDEQRILNCPGAAPGGVRFETRDALGPGD